MRTAVPPVVTPALDAVAVEDVVVTTLSGTHVRPRIVRYEFDAWGRVVNAQVFDAPAAACRPFDPPAECTPALLKRGGKCSTGTQWTTLTAGGGEVPCRGAEFVDATTRYFEALATRDIEQVRRLYAADAVLTDPAGFHPPRTFDSVYTNFYRLCDAYEYTRYPARTFVDPDARQTAQLIDAVFQMAGGGGEFTATPVQIFTFDSAMKIARFDAYFTPRRIDFSSLE